MSTVARLWTPRARSRAAAEATQLTITPLRLWAKSPEQLPIALHTFRPGIVRDTPYTITELRNRTNRSGFIECAGGYIALPDPHQSKPHPFRDRIGLRMSQWSGNRFEKINQRRLEKSATSAEQHTALCGLFHGAMLYRDVACRAERLGNAQLFHEYKTRFFATTEDVICHAERIGAHFFRQLSYQESARFRRHIGDIHSAWSSALLALEPASLVTTYQHNAPQLLSALEAFELSADLSVDTQQDPLYIRTIYRDAIKIGALFDSYQHDIPLQRDRIEAKLAFLDPDSQKLAQIHPIVDRARQPH